MTVEREAKRMEMKNCGEDIRGEKMPKTDLLKTPNYIVV